MDLSNCQRKKGNICLALKEMICKTKAECWAYTDDQNWEKEYEEAVETYNLIHK